jgi:hypothetical protein
MIYRGRDTTKPGGRGEDDDPQMGRRGPSTDGEKRRNLSTDVADGRRLIQKLRESNLNE